MERKDISCVRCKKIFNSKDANRKWCWDCENEHECISCGELTCSVRCVKCSKKEYDEREAKTCERCRTVFKPISKSYKYCESCYKLATKGRKCNICGDLFIPWEQHVICGKCWLRDKKTDERVAKCITCGGEKDKSWSELCTYCWRKYNKP